MTDATTPPPTPPPAPDVNFLEKTDDYWRETLSPLAYKVMRKHSTERAHSHDNFPKTGGIFHCAGCNSALFDQSTKYESGTGWPSFYDPLPHAPIGTKEDRRLFMRRTEVHCITCAAHLGHVFPDGPKPTGLRYCLNGVALRFEPT